MQTIVSNARIILTDKIIHGTAVVEDGVVTRIDDSLTNGSAIDFDGDYLMPGIVDIHTDNLERHYFPPPQYWMESCLRRNCP